jgi:hypothetical protein
MAALFLRCLKTPEKVMIKPIALLSLLIFASQLQAEKIYKWVDENGQIHYSSKKPPGTEVETMKVSKGPKVTPPAAEEAPVDPNEPVDPEADAEAEAQARAQLAQSDAVNRKRLCDQARNNLNALNTSVRVQRVDEKTGQTVRMTDEQRVTAMKNAQQAVKEYCN